MSQPVASPCTHFTVITEGFLFSFQVIREGLNKTPATRKWTPESRLMEERNAAVSAAARAMLDRQGGQFNRHLVHGVHKSGERFFLFILRQQGGCLIVGPVGWCVDGTFLTPLTQ